MRADKAKVINEIWDDARIDSFLNKEPMGTQIKKQSKAEIHLLLGNSSPKY